MIVCKLRDGQKVNMNKRRLDNRMLFWCSEIGEKFIKRWLCKSKHLTRSFGLTMEEVKKSFQCAEGDGIGICSPFIVDEAIALSVGKYFLQMSRWVRWVGQNSRYLMFWNFLLGQSKCRPCAYSHCFPLKLGFCFGAYGKCQNICS